MSKEFISCLRITISSVLSNYSSSHSILPSFSYLMDSRYRYTMDDMEEVVSKSESTLNVGTKRFEWTTVHSIPYIRATYGQSAEVLNVSTNHE